MSSNPAPQTPAAPAATVTISIVHPTEGATVSNPISADGTFSPVTATVTAWVIDGSGQRRDGTVTKNVNDWSATFPTAAAGAGQVHAKAQVGTQSAEDFKNITIR